MPSTNTWQLLFLCTLLINLSWASAKPLFVRFSIDVEDLDIFSYFHDSHGDFYVDIGGYDALFASNTARLDWEGINVEAHPQRHRWLVASRPHQTNVRRAVTKTTGQVIQLVTLTEDSMASVDPQFLSKNQHLNTGKSVGVQTITMADLCHRYYLKKPILMSVDIEGHGLVALESNDWSNEKCIPDVLLVETLFTKQNNDRQRGFLESKGYVLKKETNLNHLYLHSGKIDEYQKKWEQGQEMLKGYTVIYWLQLIQHIMVKIFPEKQIEFKRDIMHIEPFTSPLYVHFAHASQSILSVPDALEYSRITYEKAENRPMLILQYNPLKTQLFIGTSNFTQRNITVKDDIIMVEFVIKRQQSTDTVYVLDHRYSDSAQVTITNNQQGSERKVYCPNEGQL